jgi:HSP20 family protein
MASERDLFANFERMRREIDELFGDVFERSGVAPVRRAGFSPPVDLSYANDPPRVIVVAALPGVRLEELELEISGRELHVAGFRRPAESEGRVYQQIEIEHGRFHRVIDLGAEVVARATTATFEDGMLRVELPLSPPDGGTRSVAIRIGRSHDHSAGGSSQRLGDRGTGSGRST